MKGRILNIIYKFTSCISFGVTVLIIVLTAGCVPRSITRPAPPPPTLSLLLVTPYVGEETEIRAEPPEPGRLVHMDTSVRGWFIPAEGMLRFPVELRKSARISFRIGANTTVPIHVGDLAIRVDWVPDPGQKDFEGNPIESGVILNTTPLQIPQIFQEWYQLDLSLDQYAPSKGQIRFALSGPLAADEGLKVLFGQPVIYHPDERHHKNILLIGVDTLRFDSLGIYGQEKDITPNLDSLSANGAVFTQARSQSPWTLPSFASMITGRLPSQIGSTIFSGNLPYRNTTLGELLLDEGYATATVCSNAWLGNKQSGFHQGMDELWYVLLADAQTSVDKTKDFITRSAGRDWFCFLHLMDPHAPYTPPAEFADKFRDPDYSGIYPYGFEPIEDWKNGIVRPTDEDLEQVINLYLGEVANIDKALGDLFAFLNEKGLMEDTLIIFAADHGEEFYDHGQVEHGQSQYDELVHMPLIVWGEGFTPGTRIDANVGNTDIFPTILKYAGIDLPDNIAGNPLQDVASGDVGNGRIIFGEDNTRGPLRKFAVRWPYKCILNFVTADVELYNLAEDPGETNNIYAEYPDIVQTLSDQIVRTMRPEQTAFHVWFTRSYKEPIVKFTGTIRVPGGIYQVIPFRLRGDDTWEFDEETDTITFSINSDIEALGPNKHLMIIPKTGAETIEATVMANGIVNQDRFFPYGTREPAPSGSATVSLDSFPPGPELPLAFENYPAACYIWGVRGTEAQDESVQMDEETKDQLRSLGYVDW